ncbi:MAG: polysaccharide deacetylase [Eubacteriales bacterium]|nr:polysaccharide deacetylase [Eubacteriales bacterium]
MERLALRKKKRRRQKMVIVGALLLGVFGAAALGAYRMGLFEQVMIQTADQAAVNDRKSDTASEGEAEQESNENAEGDTESQEADPAASQSVEEESEPAYTPDAEDVSTLEQARLLAAQYDYDKAIKLLKKSKNYKKNKDMQAAVKEFKETKATCTSWPLEEVTHVFYHTLIKDTSKAFDGDYKSGDYNQVMTTIDEFNKITQTMYDRGYVMVSIYDMASVNEDGTMTRGEILLPPGKIPFVLSQDDVSYYHYMDGDGYASKLIVDEEGKVRNEYVEDDGSISVGDYDMVPLIDRFVEEHPDFSYRGAKGIVALTGYNGILGYRTDSSYETRPADLDADKVKWLDDHPEFNLEEERAGAKKVADAMKEEGWLFASHTWGHKNVADASMERLQTDTQLFKENVDPLIGGTDIIIFAFGTDMVSQGEYSGEKFEYFKSQGYNYYCNVDSSKYYVQIRDRYFRQGRRNLDGYRMYYNPELLEDLFDAGSVLDAARPLPVPEMD